MDLMKEPEKQSRNIWKKIGATVYDLTEIPPQATVILTDGTVLKSEKQQVVNTESWKPTLTGEESEG